jgi:hypothetical protein
VRTIRPVLCAIVSVALLRPISANNGLSFVADRYYFELSFGDRMEFLEQRQLAGAPIGKLNFRSILRIELPPTGNTYRAFKVPALSQTATITWNESRTLLLAAFGEYAIILSPQFHLLNVYGNTSGARWLTDREIVARVEVGGPVSKYATGEFALDVKTERLRRFNKVNR